MVDGTDGRDTRRRDETGPEDKGSKIACSALRLHPVSLAWALCDIGREKKQKKEKKHRPRLLPRCRAG